MSDESEFDERDILRAVAELLGSLLLREVTAADLAELRGDGTNEVLASMGIELPPVEIEAEWLEQTAAEFHDLFLRPANGPLVQSLWAQGRYEGDATVRVRQLAEAAGATFDAGAARGAAVDHLGSVLLLWAATDGNAQEVADELSSAHLAWALPALRPIQSSESFYAPLARAVEALIGELVPQETDS